MSELFLINRFIVGLIVAVSCWLIFLIYFAGRKKMVNKVFSVMTFFVFLWVVFGYLGDVTSNNYLATIFKRINFAAVSLFFIAMYFFTIYFPKEGKRHLILDRIVLVTGIILFLTSVFTDLIIKEVKFEKWGSDIIFGKGENFFFGAVIVLTVLIISQLFKKYYKSSKKEKLKIEYFLVGIIIFAFFNVVFNVVLPSMRGTSEYYQFGDYSAIFLLIFTAYVITKHELMGIKTLITQTLMVIISIILLVDLFLLSDNITMQLLKAGILIAFLYFSRGMVESVKKEKRVREKLKSVYKEIDQSIEDLKNINIKLEEKNEDLGALLKANDAITGILDPKKVAQDIVDSIPVNLNHLGYKGGMLVLYNKEKETVSTYAMTESETVKKAKKLLGKPFKKHSEPISANNLVIKTIKTKEMQTGSKLEDFIAPTVNAITCKMIQKLVKAKSFVSIPVLSGGRIKGAIIFVGVKPEKEITQRDKDILSGFSSHIGAAIENAELYKKTNTQMRKLEKLNDSLKKANQKLEELVEMKNEFLHITSHQLRTPLTALRGMISMWAEGSFDSLSKKKKKEMLKNICVSAERLNNITNDMLDSLELEGGVLKFRFKKAALNEIIEGAIDALKFNYDKKGLYLNFDAESKKELTVEVEPNYARQVFLNLIDNACKYTSKGGVEISVKKSGKYAEIIIKDTGIGVSKKDQERIFQKFTRSKEAIAENASGSGLGLFIVRKIVKAHYGRVEFYSEGKGKGSTVKVYLLLKQE